MIPTTEITAVHPRTRSINFIGSMITWILIALGATGITTDLDPDMTIGAFVAKNWSYIIETTVPSLIVLVNKVVGKWKAGELKWSDVKKSWNFWTFTLTVILNGLTLWINELSFDENTSQLIIDAVRNGTILSVISVVTIQIVNPIIHFIRDRKKSNEDSMPTDNLITA